MTHLVTARTAGPVPLPPEQSIAEAAKLLQRRPLGR
jgi:hypothetical protein